MTANLNQYINRLSKNLARGDASEHTHRPALKILLEALDEGVTATNEPKQITDCGKPDMAVSKRQVLLGYIETKDIGKNLTEEEKSEQLKRYRDALPNLILTDYLEFRWYVNGERRAKISLGNLGRDGKIKTKKENLAAVWDLLKQFLNYQGPTIGTAKDLALRMAGLARMLRDATRKTLETEPETGTLTGWRKAFEQTLVPNLSDAEFADMYAQTLTYGLFAAKVTVGTGQTLGRETAAGLLPETNPFLRKLFYHLAGPEVPPTVGWVMDDLIALLNAADLEAVLADFGKGSLARDPVVHFYETFLAQYDPAKRERRGVYYTPEPVVSYIVRAIDHLLKERFSRPLGLADRHTLILDPACGTGTFLHSVIALIYETLAAQGQAGGWNAYVTDHLLPRLFGFELLMAPYTVAHMKLGLLLKKTGYHFASGERLGVYLTNTLEEAIKLTEVLPLAGFITEESNRAARIKKEDPIEVILGNPPYSGHSANRSWQSRHGKRVRTFIGHLVHDYYFVDGQPLKEKNPKWLQDDYVKFLRWGQWRLTQTGGGILAMITNHGYLDNPTFRGMRQQLMQSFSEIYILNLHGNAKKKEVCPDGSKDENVFDIQQGVSIGIFVKERGKSSPARVYHADLWGLRPAKYQALTELALAHTRWQELQPQSPYYLFVPQEVDLLREYEQGWKVTDIFPVNSVGIVTARDSLTIHWSRKEVIDTVRDFAALDPETAREKYNLGKDVRDWKVELAQKDLQDSGLDDRLAVPVLYRPFDVRFTYYTGQSRGFICMPRPEVMRHMLAGENVGLVCSRQQSQQIRWSLVGVANRIIESCYLSTNTKEINYLFLLYLYLNAGKMKNNQNRLPNSYHWPIGPEGRVPNLNPEFIEDLSQRLGLDFIPDGRGDLETTFGPEDVFHYAYAVFHSPTYRQRYAEFLKLDFPRLPLTSDKSVFASLAARGAELVALHLLESKDLAHLITTYPVSGDHQVEKGYPKYLAPGEPEPGSGQPLAAGRVYINKTQYFAGVPPEVWEFRIGGYQICRKWLADRKGRRLSFDDLNRYQKIVVALQETRRLMAAIDRLIPQWPP